MCCVAIYFEVSRQFWIFDLLGLERNIKSNLWFLLSLFLLVAMYRLPQRRAARMWIKTKMGAQFFLALVLYLCLGGVSVVVNEAEQGDVQAFLFYLYAPMLVVVSMLCLHPTARTIRRTLLILFVAAVIFSVYTISLHQQLRSGLPADQVLSLYPNATDTDIGAMSRKSVPGLGSNMFPSMLVPMVLTGLYFSLRNAGRGQSAALVATGVVLYTMLITASRGAMISLAVGVLFLCWRRWFHATPRLVFAGALAVVLFASYGGSVTERFQRSFLVQGLEDYRNVGGAGVYEVPQFREGYDDRLMVSLDSLAFYFVQNPMIGAGFTNHWESQGPRLLRSTGTSGTDHNLYTQLLAEGGLFVGLPLALILFLFYRNAARMLQRSKHQREVVDLGTILLAGFVAFLVDLNFTTGYMHYFAIWWGLLLAWTRNAHVQRLATR